MAAQQITIEIPAKVLLAEKTDAESFGREIRLLAQLLDKNQLYIDLSKIDDAQFNISKEDKSLNKEFYGELQ